METLAICILILISALIALAFLYKKDADIYKKKYRAERQEKEAALDKLEESENRIESILRDQKQIRQSVYTIIRCEPNVGEYEKGLLYRKMAKNLGEKLLSSGSIELDTRTSEDNITTATMRICVIENINQLKNDKQ